MIHITATISQPVVSPLHLCSLAIPLHTDGPYNVNPLLFQVLQCIKQSPTGGESSLSDGKAAARSLQLNDPEAFKVLSETPIQFRYHDDNHDLLTERTIIEVDKLGNIGSVFFSGRLDITRVGGSPAEVDLFYRSKLKVT